jgi:hypothetical protein
MLETLRSKRSFRKTSFETPRAGRSLGAVLAWGQRPAAPGVQRRFVVVSSPFVVIALKRHA